MKRKRTMEISDEDDEDGNDEDLDDENCGDLDDDDNCRRYYVNDGEDEDEQEEQSESEYLDASEGYMSSDDEYQLWEVC
uniref:Uncharacterized protein n=1 Tax=Panagrolaimus davidi TaxID=227884 RepID=A0A914Q9G6_9BILA